MTGAAEDAGLGQAPPHPLFEPGAIGQVIEWLVWSHLVSSSRGDLRVFLPTRDMGIDGIVHRPATDSFVAVQVKGRTRLEQGVARFHVQEDETRDPRTVVVAVVVDIDSNTLRDPALVMTVAQLREHARPVAYGARRALAITVPYPPGTRTHWHDVCVPLSEVAERVCPGPPASTRAAPAAADQQDLATTGFIGESALLHHAALSPLLNTFHAAPDIGFDEYLIRHVVTGEIAGFQVKCIEVDPSSPAGFISLRLSTLSASPRAWLAVFVREAGGDVGSPCLLVPAGAIPGLPHRISDGYLHIAVDPHRLGGLARYAHPLEALPATLERIVAAAPP